MRPLDCLGKDRTQKGSNCVRRKEKVIRGETVKPRKMLYKLTTITSKAKKALDSTSKIETGYMKLSDPKISQLK